MSGYIFRYWLCLGKLMTQIFCGIYWHPGLREAFCPTPHRSAQSPHRCSQVRTAPSRCVWGVPKLRKKVPEVPKSPNPNRTGRFTHPHSFTHTHLPGAGRFLKTWTFAAATAAAGGRLLRTEQMVNSFYALAERQ